MGIGEFIVWRICFHPWPRFSGDTISITLRVPKRKSGWWNMNVSSPSNYQWSCLGRFGYTPRNLTWKLKIMFPNGLSFSRDLFSGSMLDFGGVCFPYGLFLRFVERVLNPHQDLKRRIITWEENIGIEEIFPTPMIYYRWWFQILFMFTPYLGKCTKIWRACFWNGLKLPTTLALDLLIGWFAFQGCLGSSFFSLTRDDVASSMYGI